MITDKEILKINNLLSNHVWINEFSSKGIKLKKTGTISAYAFTRIRKIIKRETKRIRKDFNDGKKERIN